MHESKDIPLKDASAPASRASSRRRRHTGSRGLEGRTLAELQQVASALGIKGAMRMRKSILIQLIREARGEEDATVTRNRPVTPRPADAPRLTVASSTPAGPERRRGTGLEGMVLAELQQVASGLGIKGTARMRKGELIQAIREAQREKTAASLPQDPTPDATPQPANDSVQDSKRQSQPTRFNMLGMRAISVGTQLLPAAARDRWQEEWRAEWADLAERHRRTRLMYLVRLTLNSAPKLAWSLRRSSQREAA
jgi:hypothetical protein